jgi:DNA-3-methyladenine glycosylase II
MSLERLSQRDYERGLRILCRRDRGLASIVKRHGRPPLWRRKPGFPALVHIILEQQVSLASAEATFRRLREAVKPFTPRHLASADETLIRAAGVTRQKTAYTRDLARALERRAIDLRALASMPDEVARDRLMSIKGIGRWTADIYLLLALGRPDVWPAGDMALAESVMRLKRLASRPDQERLDTIGAAWRPWRGVAARLLWHDYLGRKRPSFNTSSPGRRPSPSPR